MSIGYLKIHAINALIALLLSGEVSKAFTADPEKIGVKKITAETDRGIKVSVWITEYSVKAGSNVIISYEVRNHSRKAVFLVNKERPRVELNSYTYVVNEFLVGPNEGEYDYSFIRIDSGRIYHGKLVMPASKVAEAGKWLVEIDMVFVYDVSGINKKLGVGDDPVAFRTELMFRASRLRLGKLLLEVR
jgi:hypothetical protein